MTSPAKIDFAESPLNRWIQPQHLHPAAMEDFASRFRAQPQHYICIDDFMAPDRLAPIRGALLEDGVLETVGKLYGSNKFLLFKRTDGGIDAIEQITPVAGDWARLS